MNELIEIEEDLQFNTELEYNSTPNPVITDSQKIRDWVLNLQKFIKLCERPLESSKIKTFYEDPKTKQKPLFKYVPIDVIETQAKKLFMGLIDEQEPHYQVIGNEIVGTQRFRVFHPIAGVWVGVVGWAAIQIRMNSKTDHTDPRNKIKNALQLDFPHLASEIYKNAFQKFGRQFGRGLRRDYLDEYEPLIVDESGKKKQRVSNEKDNALLENLKSKVDNYYKLYANSDQLKKDTFKLIEEAKLNKMSEVNLALLKHHIQETINKWSKQ